MSHAGRVVVVGGGVIGIACAHYLRRAGHAVTVLDRGRVGGGCSAGNCGFVCPSHVLPLAAPGAVRSALATLFRRDSPLAVRWRLDPALWSWLWQFARRCNTADMLASARAIHALLQSSRHLYDELFAADAVDAEFESRGLVFVFRTPAGMKHYGDVDRLLREQFGLAARRLTGDELVRFEPALRPDLAGGWHYPGDSHLRPDRLMVSWREAVSNAGVTVHEDCPVTDFTLRGGRATAVITQLGECPADVVVIAAGAWTPLITHRFRLRLPIQPGKGYSLTTDQPDPCPVVPLLFEEDRVAVTPFRNEMRLGSLMEFAGYDERLDPRRLALLRRAAASYLRGSVPEPAREEWWGWRPMVPDGKPVIGRVSGFDNVIVAAGHGMLGVSMAPATGRLVAELVSGDRPHIEPAPFVVGRF